MRAGRSTATGQMRKGTAIRLPGRPAPRQELRSGWRPEAVQGPPRGHPTHPRTGSYPLTFGALRRCAFAVTGIERASWRLIVGILGLAALLALVPTATPADAGPAGTPPACASDCASRYGEVLGTAAPGVPAYSNCSPACVSLEPHLQEGRFLGVKWQCVEFARRWLFTAKGAVFGDVDIAADFWRKVDALTRVADGSPVPLTAYPNGSSARPEPSDLLVYGDELLGTGHLAVVTRVNPAGGFIEVAEQLRLVTAAYVRVSYGPLTSWLADVGRDPADRSLAVRWFAGGPGRLAPSRPAPRGPGQP